MAREFMLGPGSDLVESPLEAVDGTVFDLEYSWMQAAGIQGPDTDDVSVDNMMGPFPSPEVAERVVLSRCPNARRI
jgi:hypothetical protein